LLDTVTRLSQRQCSTATARKTKPLSCAFIQCLQHRLDEHDAERG